MSAAVLCNYEDLAEPLLAVSEEEEVWFEEETCYLLLLGIEAPGTPEKDKYGSHHEIEHGVITLMAPPAETAHQCLRMKGSH